MQELINVKFQSVSFFALLHVNNKFVCMYELIDFLDVLHQDIIKALTEFDDVNVNLLETVRNGAMNYLCAYINERENKCIRVSHERC